MLCIQNVYEESHPPLKPIPEFAELLGDVGNYLWERALYEQGVKSLELAESIYQAYPSWNLMQQSMVSTILGVLRQEIGISGRKRGLDRCAKSLTLRREYIDLTRSKQIKPTESQWLLLANAWNDVACSMLEYGNNTQAEEYLQQSLDIKRNMGSREDGPAFLNFAENYKNLSLVRIAQGLHDDAQELTSRATRLIKCGYSGDSATAQAFKFHQAYALFHAGKLDEAYQMHYEAFQARERIFGQTGFTVSTVLMPAGLCFTPWAVCKRQGIFTPSYRDDHFVLTLAALFSGNAYHPWGRAAGHLNVLPVHNIALLLYCVMPLACPMK